MGELAGWVRAFGAASCVALVSLAVGACGGDDAETTAATEGTGAGPATATESTESTTAGTDTGSVPGECGGLLDPGPTPLRRLTHTQYNNTVNDLFPGIPIPVQTILVDPKAGGFENSGEMQHASALLIEQYQKAALGVVGAARDGEFIGCLPDGGANPTQCGHDFLVDFGRRAFRRPLTDDEQAAFLGYFDTQLAATNFNVAIQLAVQAFLQAPPFLYFLEFDGQAVEGEDDGIVLIEPYALASRMSYFLWDTMPDEALMAAAANGDLATREGVEAEARRMLDMTPARAASVNFHRQWLELDEIESLSRNLETYPNWDAEAMAPAMREQIERFVEHVIFDGEGTLQSLLTTDEAVVDSVTAELYGVAPPAPGTWEVRPLDASQRAGVLTTPGWLAAHAHEVHPSPVQRGVFVLERMLCTAPAAPPPDVDTNPPQDDGDPKTNRERYEAHATDPACSGCHQFIDGIGMGYEHYDSLGQWRATDNGFPVDASGELLGTDQDGPFQDAIGLAAKLGDSASVRRCVATQYFRYALGRSDDSADMCAHELLNAEFETTGGDIRELLVSIVTSDAFRYRRSEGQG